MKRGFTLIELLLVIVIIGILSTIVAVGFPSYIKRANDAQRKSDLKQYQVVLETYANAHNSIYPTGSGHLSSIASGPENSKCPDDPQYCYGYISLNSGLDYIIWGKLESKTNTYWVSCSAKGKTGESVGVPSIDCSSVI